MFRIKNSIFIFTFAITNIFISFSISSLLNIKNVILFKSYFLTIGDITFELLFFIILSLLEAFVYEYFKFNNK